MWLLRAKKSPVALQLLCCRRDEHGPDKQQRSLLRSGGRYRGSVAKTVIVKEAFLASSNAESIEVILQLPPLGLAFSKHLHRTPEKLSTFMHC